MKLNMTDYRFTHVASDSIYTIHVDELLEALDKFMIKVKYKLKSLNPEVKEFTVSINTTEEFHSTCDFSFNLMHNDVLPNDIGVLIIHVSKELYFDVESWSLTIKRLQDIGNGILSYLIGMEVRLDEQTSDEKEVQESSKDS